MSDEQAWVTVSREFDAPIEVVWDMWTVPALFCQWYGPSGFTVPEVIMNVVPGGTRKICMQMQTPDQTISMWFTGVYKEVNRPHRLVYTESMCDADGTILSPQAMGMPKDHPDITEVIIELEELDGKTQMTMIHKGVPEGTAAAGGWTQAFEKLAKLLQEKP